MSTPILTAVDDARQSSRFPKEPSTDYAALWYPEEVERTVEVFDESLTGMSIVVDCISGFAPDKEIGVAYAGSYLRSFVRHTRQLEDGRYLVGLECERMP